MGKFKQIGAAVLSGFLILGTGAELIFANELTQSDTKTVYSDEDCESLITAYFNAANEKDWNTFMKYVCQEDYNYFVNYFADASEKNGIKQLDSVNVSDLYKIDESEASQYFITDEYDVLTAGNTYSYIAEINCSTETENQYFIDGYNYILMVLAEENNELKVVQVNKPNTELLEKYVINNVEAEAECYEAKQAGINAIEECDNGRLVDSDGELITDGFEIATAEIVDSNPASRSYNKLSHYTTYSYPSSIRVKLNKTGNNAITRVDKLILISGKDYNKEVIEYGLIVIRNGVIESVGRLIAGYIVTFIFLKLNKQEYFGVMITSMIEIIISMLIGKAIYMKDN